jgi:hypothetical protein
MTRTEPRTFTRTILPPPPRTPMPSAERILAYARSAGAMAKAVGRPMTDNTYGRDQVGHQAWIDGWNDKPDEDAKCS